MKQFRLIFGLASRFDGSDLVPDQEQMGRVMRALDDIGDWLSTSKVEVCTLGGHKSFQIEAEFVAEAEDNAHLRFHNLRNVAPTVTLQKVKIKTLASD